MGSIIRINHVAIVVDNLEEALSISSYDLDIRLMITG